MNENTLAGGCGCLASLAAVVALFLFIIWGVENAYNEGNAQIESLRSDAAFVDPAQAEDVIGQVTQWNQRIVAEQYQNTIPIVGFFTSDRWNDVKLIPVPRE